MPLLWVKAVKLVKRTGELRRYFHIGIVVGGCLKHFYVVLKYTGKTIITQSI